jgi:hypothetical protein
MDVKILFHQESIPSPDYALKVKLIRKGDFITFSDGKIFSVKKVLPRSVPLTTSYEVGDDRALIVPNHVVQIDPFNPLETMTYLDHIKKMKKGYASLKKHNINVVEILEDHPPEYLIVRSFNYHITYEDYLFDKKWKKWSPTVKKLMQQRLVKFIRSTWKFEHISGLDPETLVYSHERGWFLRHYGSKHKYASKKSKRTVFSTITDPHGKEPVRTLQIPLPKDIEKKMLREIASLREKGYSSIK